MKPVPDYKLQKPERPPQLYAKLRAWILFDPQSGDETEDGALDVAVQELKALIQSMRLRRPVPAWVELEDWEHIGFERE